VLFLLSFIVAESMATIPLVALIGLMFAVSENVLAQGSFNLFGKVLVYNFATTPSIRAISM
jgi:hypothetical protein